MKSLELTRIDASQIQRLKVTGSWRVVEQLAGLWSLSSHPPFISVFTGRSGNARSDQEDRATTQKHTTDKEKA